MKTPYSAAMGYEAGHLKLSHVMGMGHVLGLQRQGRPMQRRSLIHNASVAALRLRSTMYAASLTSMRRLPPRQATGPQVISAHLEPLLMRWSANDFPQLAPVPLGRAFAAGVSAGGFFRGEL